MERGALIRALLREDVASRACAEALDGGADFEVYEGEVATADLMAIYRRRARHVAAIGLEHGGFEEALIDLGRCGAEVLRLGAVTDRRGRRHFQLFVSADADDVVACLWVRHEAEDHLPER
ncbi:hypothetical protein [Nocardioides euryhalodurans]|uniref:Uncharacterized protein n=1 Tax=Nocardioides euryhalodurans TaxID=2518370 RepID=A0A4P7GHY9_9ACTN|nr:hypothetical protein [Nocardioides euryhalodurans]QBR91550.1 hypothetical protein EXE57_04130 [Nocardioides euryhalodurans]